MSFRKEQKKKKFTTFSSCQGSDIASGLSDISQQAKHFGHALKLCKDDHDPKLDIIIYLVKIHSHILKILSGNKILSDNAYLKNCLFAVPHPCVFFVVG